VREANGSKCRGKVRGENTEEEMDRLNTDDMEVQE